MPETFEVVFIDKIVGIERSAVVDWENSCQVDFNRVVSRGKVKVIKKYHGCKASDLVFLSLRFFPHYTI